MADFHHLGYFPFCITAPLQPLSRAVEMPLADAMRIFWLAKTVQVVLQFSYNAHTGLGVTAPDSFVRAICNIDEQKSVFDEKSPQQRVCLNEAAVISGSVANQDAEGSTQYVLQLFSNATFSTNETFPRVTASDVSGIVPVDARVRITAALSISSVGYYSRVSWFNGTEPPFGQFGGQVLPVVISVGGNSYELSTGVNFIAYPFIAVGGPVPDASFGRLEFNFLT